MKIATVCSGIGSPEQALKELNIPHEIAFACEIDKYARQTYLANFTPNQMYQDLTAEEWDKPEQYSDLFIGGIPCQAFSLAGKRLGELDKRGLLFYDFYRYVKNQQPKVFIIENVKGLLSDNNGITFQNWRALLGRSMNTHVNMFNHDDSLLYNLHFKVLNSKDFGVPQNRERVFLIGVRNDLPNTFRFPIGERLTKRLKDILEPEVDEKYYLSDACISRLTNEGKGHRIVIKKEDDIACTVLASDFKLARGMNIFEEPYCVAMRGRDPENPSDRTKGAPTEQRLEPNSQGITNTITSVQKDNLIVEPELKKVGQLEGFEQSGRIYSENGISQTISSQTGGIGRTTGLYAVNEAAELIMMGSLEGGKWDKMHESIRRYYNPNGISPTVTAMGGGNQEPKTVINQRIRRLTPLECMRLQGYPDSFTDTIKTHNIINKQGILIIFKEKNIWENVQLKTAKGSVKQKDIALCTIKELENMEMQTSFSSIAIGEMKNVKFKVAIEVLTALDIAQHITTLTENTEIHFTGRKSLKKYELEKVQQEGAGGLDQIPIIELLFNVTLEENLKRENAYIILIVIPIIMKLATCMFSNHKKNTIAVILNYKNLPKNYSKQECLLLKMGNTLSISDSQTYKQAGNSITVNVMKAIIKNIIPIL